MRASPEKTGLADTGVAIGDVPRFFSPPEMSECALFRTPLG